MENPEEKPVLGAQDNTTPVSNTSPDSINQLNDRISKESTFVDLLKQEMHKVIIGQKDMVDKLILSLLADGHILLEGVPGLAKTLAITALSRCVDVDFSRVQFTPDLLPADLIGTMIFNQKDGDFKVKKGPVFANFVLADEINRAPAKVQSALLEAMQERQVTIGGTTYPLPKPFLVLATQNPIDQEGTYPLPEAQVDRFMMKIIIGYPEKKEEQMIIRSSISKDPFPKANKVVTIDQILKARELVREVYLDEKIEQYIIDLVFATRNPADYNMPQLVDLISFGASPRASISMAILAKAYAFTKHRGYVIPEDIRAVAHDILRHRIGLSYEAEAEDKTTEDIIVEILNNVEVP